MVIGENISYKTKVMVRTYFWVDYYCTKNSLKKDNRLFLADRIIELVGLPHKIQLTKIIKINQDENRKKCK